MDIGLTLVGDATGMNALEALGSLQRLGRVAEEEGIDTLWFTEHHHNVTRASSNIPVLMGAVGAKTSLKLGAATLLPALHDPIRTAEAMGTLEALYPGRMLWGFGKGGGSEVTHTHIEDITPENVRKKMLYSIDRMLQMRQVSEPMPPMSQKVPWFIASRNAEAVRFAADHGMGLMFGHKWPLAELEALVSLYREHHREGDAPKVMLSRHFYCDDNDASARSRTLAAFDARRRHMQALGRAQAGLQAHEIDFEESLIGTPQACRERMARYRELGVTYLSLRPVSGHTEEIGRWLASLGR